MKDIRAFLYSILEETKDLHKCYIRGHIPSFVRQWMRIKSGYSGLSVRISDEDLSDCLHICAFPKHELDGITVEESLCSAGRSVAPATDAADMPRLVGPLFGAMCKIVAEAGPTEFSMIDGDVNGSWKPAPAQLLTRMFFYARSPDMFRHACTSQLIVNDELCSRPVQLFLMVEREAEAWPRTYHLTAVQDSMSMDNLSYSHSDNLSDSHSGSRRYQQSSSVSSGSHFCPSRGATGITKNRGGYAGRTIQRKTSQGVRRAGGTPSSAWHNNIYPAFSRVIFSGSVGLLPWDISNLRLSVNTHLFCPMDDTADRCSGFVSSYDPDGALDGTIRGGGVVLHPTSSRV